MGKGTAATLAIAATGAAAVVGAMVMSKKAEQARLKNLQPHEPQAAELPFPAKLGRALEGLRVLELSSVMAAPSATRILANLGAQVIKVEPPSGDMLRNFMLAFDGQDQPPPTRPHGAMFENLNFDKTSVQLDLNNPRHMEYFKALLRSADVFVTNVRPKSLRKLGLEYASVKAECPSLVYAHITAYGLSGPEAQNAGYDIGAFWASTGLAYNTHSGRPWRAGLKAGGFGDLTTAQTLIAGIMSALVRRERHLQGGLYVDTSLLRSGIWACAAEILSAKEEEETTPQSDPLHTAAYTTSDGQQLYLMSIPQGPIRRDPLAKAVATALHLSLPLTYAPLAKAIYARRCKAVEALMSGLGLSCARLQPLMKAGDDPRLRFGYADKVPEGRWPGEFDRVLKEPYDLSCSTHHGPQRRCPFKGEHTKCVVDSLDKGNLPWQVRPRCPDPTPVDVPPERTLAESLWRPLSASRPPRGCLSGIMVVELSDVCSMATDVSAGACCASLADLGATVVRVVSQTAATARVASTLAPVPGLPAHLDRGKWLCTPIQLQQACTTTMDLCRSATVVVTSLGDGALRSRGRWGESWDFAELEARTKHRQDGLILTRITPWGLAAERAHPRGDDSVSTGATASMWCATGLGSLFQAGLGLLPVDTPGKNADDISRGVPEATRQSMPPVSIPRHCLELMCACFAQAGTTMALYYQQVTTQGTGQTVDVSFAQCGMWYNGNLQCFFRPLNRNLVPIYEENIINQPKFAVPTSNVFQTKDGRYVQLLGIEIPRWLPYMISKFGVRWQVARAVGRLLLLRGWTFFNAHLITKAKMLFKSINRIFARRIGSMTLHEVQAFFAAHDIWYCQVRQAQRVRHHYKQAKAGGSFLQTLGGANVISTPMFVGGDFGLLSDAQQLEGDTMTALTKEIERQLLLQKRDKTVQPPQKNINMMPTRAKL